MGNPRHQSISPKIRKFDQQNHQPLTNNSPHTRMIKNEKNKDLSNFEVFYKAYPKHKARKDAVKAWVKLNPSLELQALILTAIEKQKNTEDWQKEKGKYIPLPASWLNGQRWEDEVQEIKDKWTA